MDILEQLVSQSGDRRANHTVAAQCLEDQTLIPAIVAGLQSSDNKIAVDCTEVLTEVAKQQPAYVAPYAHLLPAMLDNRNNRARWEAMHCLALIAELTPPVIAPLLDRLLSIIEMDKSVIVRDYAVDTLGNYAKTGVVAAQAAYPILERAAQVWDAKHAKRALNGLFHVAQLVPEKLIPVQTLAEENLSHSKGTVRKVAKQILRELEKM